LYTIQGSIQPISTMATGDVVLKEMTGLDWELLQLVTPQKDEMWWQSRLQELAMASLFLHATLATTPRTLETTLSQTLRSIHDRSLVGRSRLSQMALSWLLRIQWAQLQVWGAVVSTCIIVETVMRLCTQVIWRHRCLRRQVRICL
jgi:hypothetical protein